LIQTTEEAIAFLALAKKQLAEAQIRKEWAQALADAYEGREASGNDKLIFGYGLCNYWEFVRIAEAYYGDELSLDWDEDNVSLFATMFREVVGDQMAEYDVNPFFARSRGNVFRLHFM
tara:strand:- start:471 stop:824 length:354 start_codon:yes stop_codon:yes gene_type:complete